MLTCAIAFSVLIGTSWQWWPMWDADVGQQRIAVMSACGRASFLRMPKDKMRMAASGPSIGAAPKKLVALYDLMWVPKFQNEKGFTMIQVPLWIPLLLTLVPYLILARADRIAAKRERVGTCPKCGYSRAGLAPDAACPECGKVGAADAVKA